MGIVWVVIGRHAHLQRLILADSNIDVTRLCYCSRVNVRVLKNVYALACPAYLAFLVVTGS